MSKRYALVLNMSSGQREHEEVADYVAAVLAEHDIALETFAAKDGADLPALAEEAARGGFDAVVAAGGDGTVSCVGQRLTHTGIPFGVLPRGTLNHFAKDLGIPLALDQATQVLVDGEVRAVDVGEVNGRLFLNNAQSGLYQRMVRVEKEEVGRRGVRRLRGFASGFRQVMRRHPRFRIRTEADGHVVEEEASLVIVANNRYEGRGTQVTRRPRLDEAVLDLHIAKTRTTSDVVRLLTHAATGSLENDPHHREAVAHEITIERISRARAPGAARRRRSRPVEMTLDGELVSLAPPLRFRVHPGALKVIAPPPELTSRAGL